MLLRLILIRLGCAKCTYTTTEWSFTTYVQWDTNIWRHFSCRTQMWLCGTSSTSVVCTDFEDTKTSSHRPCSSKTRISWSPGKACLYSKNKWLKLIKDHIILTSYRSPLLFLVLRTTLWSGGIWTHSTALTPWWAIAVRWGTVVQFWLCDQIT